MVLKSIGPLSVGKMFAILQGVVGLIAGSFLALLGLLGLAAGSAEGTPLTSLLFGGAAIVVLPVVYAIFGFVAGTVGALIYNVVAGVVGGIEVVLE